MDEKTLDEIESRLKVAIIDVRSAKMVSDVEALVAEARRLRAEIESLTVCERCGSSLNKDDCWRCL